MILQVLSSLYTSIIVKQMCYFNMFAFHLFVPKAREFRKLVVAWRSSPAWQGKSCRNLTRLLSHGKAPGFLLWDELL